MIFKVKLFIFCYLFLLLIHLNESAKWDLREVRHEPKQLPKNEYKKLISFTNNDYELFNSTLDAILIPRVPGTQSHRRVQKFIEQMMKSLEWDVETDKFSALTPHGNRKFTNIIATHDPNVCRKLVFACHYDSKVNREGTFVGATDSAVPCTIMIQLANILNEYLKVQKNESKIPDITLQLIFFDGEEAFEKWTDDDSLYGSRHLANKLERKMIVRTDADNNQNRCGHLLSINNEIDSIDVMVLLDLLGAKNPNFYSYFLNTQQLFSRLLRIETILNELSQMETPNRKRTSYFKSKSSFALISDDHIPFLRRSVPIIHLIPHPFPSVWHRESDNRDNLHHPTINNLLKIFKIFIIEYLHLDISN